LRIVLIVMVAVTGVWEIVELGLRAGMIPDEDPGCVLVRVWFGGPLRSLRTALPHARPDDR
jgi:hypothetical protein